MAKFFNLGWELPVLAFLVSLVLHIWLFPFLNMPSSTIDEVSTIASAASIAGYHWKDVLIRSGSYYGFGFSFLLAPVFMVTKNPYVIYNVFRFACAIAASLPALLSYRLMRHYYDLENKKILFAGAISCTLFNNIIPTTVYNEPALILMVWAIFYMIVKLQHVEENSPKKDRLSFITVFILCYTLTLHSRAILLLAVFFLLVLVYRLYTSKWLVNLWVALPTGIGGYFIFNSLIQKMQQIMFDGRAVINSTDAMTKQLTSGIWENFKYFGVWESIKSIITLFFTNALATCVFSGGLILVVGWVLFFRSGCITVRRFKNKEHGFKKDILFPALFSAGCFLAALAGHSIYNVFHPAFLRQGELYGDGRFFFYLRYYFNFSGPLLLVLIVLLFSSKPNPKRIKKLAICSLSSLGCIFAFFFFSFILTLARNDIPAFDTGTVFSALLFRAGDSQFEYFHYGLATLVTCLVLVGTFVLVFYKKAVLSILLCCLLMVHQQTFDVLNVRMPIVNADANYFDATYDFFIRHPEFLENTGILYFVSSGGYRLDADVQLLFPHIKVIGNLPSSNVREAIVVSDTPIADTGYHYMLLDNNEVLYMKGKDLIGTVEEKGITLMQQTGITFTANTRPLYLHHSVLDDDEDPVAEKNNETGSITLYQNGIQFGPYVDLPSGKYVLEIEGKNLDSALFSITKNAGEDSLKHLISLSSSTCTRVEFTLTREAQNVEFVHYYLGNKSVTVDSMVLYIC